MTGITSIIKLNYFKPFTTKQKGINETAKYKMSKQLVIMLTDQKNIAIPTTFGSTLEKSLNAQSWYKSWCVARTLPIHWENNNPFVTKELL